MSSGPDVLNRRMLLAGAAAASVQAFPARAVGARPPRSLVIGGTGAALGTVRRLVAAFRAEHPEVEADVPNSLGSTGGMRAVLAGAIDLATATRAVTPEEAAVGARATPLGRSPFAFVTSLREPPTALTSADVLEIYALKRRTWPDGSPLRLILRTRSDGDTAFLIDRFPDLATILESTHARQVVPVTQTDQQNLDLAEKLEGSFATSTLCAVVSEERRLRPMAIDGVPPSMDAVERGAYPHMRLLNLVATPTTSEAGHAFLAFVRSPRAREILAGCAIAPMA